MTTWPKPPLPNSYWVQPGRLLAGEYPGASSLAETSKRLQKLLAAGVTLFVDLTADGELATYNELFEYAQGDKVIRHVRHPITDHGVPDSPQVMEGILGDIEAHLDDAGIAYVHCRAGIGRTGTVIGCYLVRTGLIADAALDRLNQLWTECERSRTWPSIPETEEQIEFIERWESIDPKLIAARTRSAGISERYIGAVLGMAIGDALGGLVKVKAPTTPGENATTEPVTEMTGGGPQDLPRGAWLADTAMCWCLAESLLACKGSNPQDQMERYLAWQRDGKFSSTGAAMNVPLEVGKALAQWQWSRKPIAGSHDPKNRDAHALARTTASVLFFANEPSRVLIESGESARTTLQSPIVLDASRAFGMAMLDALNGIDKEILLSMKRSENAQRLRANRLKLPITQVIDGWWRGPAPPARGGSDVLAVLSTVLWAFDQTDNFRDGVLLAVNSCASPSHAGAAFGALAGAYYGAQSIPIEWRNAVRHVEDLTRLAERLAGRS